MDDETIVELCWKRDASAISATDAAYGAHCRALAFRILGSREDAEECANDTWVRLWNAIPPQRRAKTGRRRAGCSGASRSTPPT